MCVNVCINVKHFVLMGIIGGLCCALYVKETKINSLTKDIEEMKAMKGD